jgi:hypothetical protein
MSEQRDLTAPWTWQASEPILSSERATRVLEREGRQWMVYEHVRSYDRRSSPDLVFESDAVVRRLRNFPSSWHALSSDELWALCQGSGEGG